MTGELCYTTRWLRTAAVDVLNNYHREANCSQLGWQIDLLSYKTQLIYKLKICATQSVSAKPEYQAFIQAQPTDDIARSFAVAISATAKQLDALIGALPEEEASADIQRATVHKLLEAYRSEGAKLARITTRLESRLAENQRCIENFMETNPNLSLNNDSSYEAPEYIYSSPPSSISWLAYLTTIFLFILFFRLCFTFGIVDRLHALVNFILAISTPSGRKRRALRAKCVEDLGNLRTQLKSVHMVDEFATYSKLERKIKLLERQLNSLAPETLVGSTQIVAMKHDPMFSSNCIPYLVDNNTITCGSYCGLGYKLKYTFF
ncbi:unnamed protein product [Schistosoma intercalatum]|nr:unnamed protein product [Schistosoma intercalatum]CAH8434346.1 unnamed protein product [Schistosoma intercalatum]